MKLLSLAKKYNYICFWCNDRFLLEDLSRDHKVPQNCRYKNSDAGSCVLSCRVCNNKRGNMDFEYCRQNKKLLFKKYSHKLNRL